MDTRQFLDAIGRVLKVGDETLLEQLGELLLKAHAAEIERAKRSGQHDITESPLVAALTKTDA
jgi:hypothetical protein